MKMISIDNIIEICDINILPLKARGQSVAVAALRRVIDAAKEYAVDAELVKHGKWMGTVCTACGESDSLYFNHDFCPNCGARMSGDVNDKHI